MKISIISPLLVLSGLILPAEPHSLLRRRAPPLPALAPAAAPPGATVDPLAIVSGSGGGDFFSKAYTGENAGDTKRGTGDCTAFRRTLQCNPSGPRHPKEDKGCQQVVTAEESGYCECGDFAQFAAVDCNHRPFTCEVMCVKFAMVTGKPVVWRGQQLSGPAAQALINKVMWGNQTDLEAMKLMTADIQDYMTRSLQYSTDSANVAKQSMKKFLDMMRQAREKDAGAAAAETERYRQMIKNRPWVQIWRDGQTMIDAGKGIQAKVQEVLPFAPEK